VLQALVNRLETSQAGFGTEVKSRVLNIEKFKRTKENRNSQNKHYIQLRSTYLDFSLLALHAP